MTILTLPPANAFQLLSCVRSVLGVEFTGVGSGSMFLAIPWYVDGTIDDIAVEWNSSSGTAYAMSLVQSSGGSLSTLCTKSGTVSAGPHHTTLASSPTSGSMPQYLSEGAWYYLVFQAVSGDDLYSVDVTVTAP